MTTLHCPLCGLRFRYGSELDQHAREDHAPPPHLHCPPAPQPRTDADQPAEEHDPVLHLPW